MRLTPERTAALAEAAGLSLPAERLEPVTEALSELLGHAQALEELPLDGVEPLLGDPAWE